MSPERERPPRARGGRQSRLGSGVNRHRTTLTPAENRIAAYLRTSSRHDEELTVLLAGIKAYIVGRAA